jgi:integrase
MPKKVAPLSDAKIRQTTPGASPIRLSDGDGLYLLVQPDGARWWRFAYALHGRRNTLSFGVYPATSLKLAREKRLAARALLAAGSDPSVERKADKARAKAETFGEVAREWLDQQRATLARVTYEKARWMLFELAGPWLGARPMRVIEPPEVLAVLRRIEGTGRRETAHRVRQRISQVFRYAIATGRATRDPIPDLRGALAPVVSKHRAAVTSPDEVGELLRACDAFGGSFVVASALRLAPLVFVRPGELRRAEWAEIDLDAAEWRLPAEKMKMREPHLVPLSRQALALLHDLKPLTGAGRYVFPSLRTTSRPMSENTINAALRRMGYDGTVHVGHGFRAMASTLLNELGWAPDVVDRQLSHRERNKVRAAYNRALHLPERRRMMQAWADYLDGLKAGAEVQPIMRRA